MKVWFVPEVIAKDYLNSNETFETNFNILRSHILTLNDTFACLTHMYLHVRT